MEEVSNYRKEKQLLKSILCDLLMLNYLLSPKLGINNPNTFIEDLDYNEMIVEENIDKNKTKTLK